MSKNTNGCPAIEGTNERTNERLTALARELAVKADALHAEGKHAEAKKTERQRLAIERTLDRRARGV